MNLLTPEENDSKAISSSVSVSEDCSFTQWSCSSTLGYAKYFPGAGEWGFEVLTRPETVDFQIEKAIIIAYDCILLLSIVAFCIGGFAVLCCLATHRISQSLPETKKRGCGGRWRTAGCSKHSLVEGPARSLAWITGSWSLLCDAQWHTKYMDGGSAIAGASHRFEQNGHRSECGLVSGM